MVRSKKDNIWKTAMMVILLAMCVVILVPYIWMLSNSFKSNKEILSDPGHLIPQEFSVEGYQEVFKNSPFFRWLGNSLFITAVSVGVSLLSSTLVGYIFSKYQFRFKSILFLVLLSTMMVPPQTTMVPAFLLTTRLGLYDSVWAVIIPAFVHVFGIYLCKQYCDEIPRELMESAKLDGAGDFSVFFHIVIPQIRPAIGALAIFQFLNCWNDYLRPLLYLSSSEQMTLPLAINYFSNMHRSDVAATMAVSALIMLPSAIVFIIFQKQFIKGIAMTGMK